LWIIVLGWVLRGRCWWERMESSSIRSCNVCYMLGYQLFVASLPFGHPTSTLGTYPGLAEDLTILVRTMIHSKMQYSVKRGAE
jgi:hypothetical protein